MPLRFDKIGDPRCPLEIPGVNSEQAKDGSVIDPKGLHLGFLGVKKYFPQVSS